MLTSVPEDQDADPFVAAAVFIVGRRYGYAELERYRVIALANLDKNSIPAKSQLRLIDPAARPDLSAVPESATIARLLGEALACDQPGAPAPDPSKLARLAAEGAYVTTHVALSLSLRQDLGCDVSGMTDVQRVTAEILEHDLRTDVVDDLWLEQLAMMLELEGPAALDDRRMALVLGSQRDDGLWFDNLHSTAIGLGLVSERLKAGAPDF